MLQNMLTNRQGWHFSMVHMAGVIYHPLVARCDPGTNCIWFPMDFWKRQKQLKACSNINSFKWWGWPEPIFDNAEECILQQSFWFFELICIAPFFVEYAKYLFHHGLFPWVGHRGACALWQNIEITILSRSMRSQYLYASKIKPDNKRKWKTCLCT